LFLFSFSFFVNHAVVGKARKTENKQNPKKFTAHEEHKEMSTPEELAL
jgi:hypothetical protein